jgi:hypothetical protein
VRWEVVASELEAGASLTDDCNPLPLGDQRRLHPEAMEQMHSALFFVLVSFMF